MISITPKLRITALVVFAASLSGCANMAQKDPYEQYNRNVFEFNDAIDRNALKPAATVYKQVLPSFVQTGVNNFFGNLADVWSSANNLMQGKGEAGMSDLTRVMMNTTFGFGGVLDIATEAGLKKHTEDFGQTLGYWGMPSGPYLMLPLLGPSTLRDTAALPLDIAADPWGTGVSSGVHATGVVLRVVDQRAVLLDATNIMEGAALDRYEFIRDGFLQSRKNKVFDGEGSRKEAVEAARVDAGDAKKAAPADEPTAKSISDAYPDDPAKMDPKVEPKADPKGAPKVEATKPVSSKTPSK